MQSYFLRYIECTTNAETFHQTYLNKLFVIGVKATCVNFIMANVTSGDKLLQFTISSFSFIFI